MRRLLFPLFFLVCSLSQAKQLEGRVGLGLSLLDYRRLGALSMRVHPTPHVGITFLGSLNTDSSQSTTILGLRSMRNFNLEENLNFFAGGGLLYISDKGGTGTSQSGFELAGIIGAEFFMPGLSNLGIEFQTGIAVRTLGSTAIKTLGDGFAGLGIHYYF